MPSTFFPIQKNSPKNTAVRDSASQKKKSLGEVGHGKNHLFTHTNRFGSAPPYFVKQFNIPRAIIVPKIGKELNLKDLKKLRMKGMSATHFCNFCAIIKR